MTWTLDKIKELLHNDSLTADPEAISAMWWLIRHVDELKRVSGIFHDNLSRSVQRRLDVQGVIFDAEKGKISFDEGRSVRQPRRPRVRPSHGGRGPFVSSHSD